MGKGFITYKDEKPREKPGGGSRRGKTRKALNKSNFDKARKSASSAGSAVNVGLVVFAAAIITGLADHYLGLYAWITGSLAILDRLGWSTISKDTYMNLALIGLGVVIVLKIGTYGGKNRPWKGFKPRR